MDRISKNYCLKHLHKTPVVVLTLVRILTIKLYHNLGDFHIQDAFDGRDPSNAFRFLADVRK